MIMKKRLVIGKLLKGDKRLKGETFVEYKERMKLEKSLLKYYLSATRSKKEAARFLGINLDHFKKLIKKYNTESYFEDLDKK